MNAWRLLEARLHGNEFRSPGEGRAATYQDALARGELGRLDNERVWAGPATGQTCHACHERIDAPDPEYEVDGLQIFLHVLCYAIWRAESRRAVAE